MSIIKKKVKLKKTDIKLTIPFGGVNRMVGDEDAINDFIEDSTGLSINPADDGELYRFKGDSSLLFNVKFHNTTTDVFDYDIRYAGFTDDELNKFDSVILKSFYIVELFNSVKYENQNRLHIGYYSGLNFNNNTTSKELSKYDLDNNNNEFSFYYIGNNKILDGLEIVYVRYSFYNAKTGKIHVFYNEDKTLLTTEDKMYFSIALNKPNKKYNTSGEHNLIEFNDDTYANRISNTIDNLPKEKNMFPDGNIFNNGEYFDNSQS